MADIAQLERALVNADAAGDGDAARVFAAEIRKMRASPEAKPESSTAANIVKGAATGLADLGSTVLDAALYLPGKVSPSIAQWNRTRNADMEYITDQNKDSTAFNLSRVGANVAATLPVGGLLGQGVKAISQAPRAMAFGNALASGGFKAGETPGIVNALTRAAGGAVTGGASTALVDPEHAGTGAIAGGVLPSALSAAGKVGGHIGSSAKALVQPFTAAGQEAIAGKIINKFAEGGPTAINRAELVPGSMPTLAEATGNPGLATLQRGARDVRPNAFAEREVANAGARSAAFDKAAGDANQLDFFRADRAQIGKELYGKAMEQGVDPAALTPFVKGQVTQLLQRPSIKAAMADAKKLAAEDGIKLTDSTSLQGLHYTKLSLDQQVNDAMRAGNNTLARSLMGTKDMLEGTMTKMSPAYAEARATFAEMSKPVNAMETLQNLKLTDAQGNITLSKIQNAIRTLEAKISGPGTDKAKSLSGEQISTLTAIRDDLLRQSKLSAGKSIGSNTFQNLATDNIISTILPGRLGGVAAEKAGGVFGQFGRLAYSGPNEAIRNRLADMMLQPELATNALNPAMPQLSGFRTGLNALADRTAPSVYRAVPLLSSDRR